MLKFIPKTTYKTKVAILIPGDFGTTERVEFTVEFRRLQHEEAKAVLTRIGDFARQMSTARLATVTDLADGSDIDADLLEANLVGWSGVPAAAGGEVAFSPEALTEMLKHQCYRHGLVRLFLDGLRNHPEPAIKN